MSLTNQQIIFNGSFDSSIFVGNYDMSSSNQIIANPPKLPMPISKLHACQIKIEEEKQKLLPYVYDYLISIIKEYGKNVDVKFTGLGKSIHYNYDDSIKIVDGRFHMGPFASFDKEKIKNLIILIREAFGTCNIITSTSYSNVGLLLCSGIVDILTINITSWDNKKEIFEIFDGLDVPKIKTKNLTHKSLLGGIGYLFPNYCEKNKAKDN